MKKYFFPLICSAVLLTSCGREATVENTKKPYDIDVVLASTLSRSSFVEKTALVKAGTQVNLAAQASGRVGTLLVKP